MWLLNEQPARLAVIGAGASGAEIASAFGRFGTEVVLIEMLDQILPLEDAEIAKVVASRAQQAEREGRDRRAGREREGAARSVELDWGEGAQSFDYLCIAAGRAPDVEGLGPRRGRRQDRRARHDRGRRAACAPRPTASGRSATSCHGPALAHKASDEGIIAVEDAAGLADAPARLRRHPRRHLLLAAGGELRPHRGGGARARRGRRRRASSRWAVSARRPSTATARAW